MTDVTGEMLRDLREWAGLTVREVARRSARSSGGRAELSDSHLSRVERSKRPVTPAVVAAYQRALGMPINEYVIKELVTQGALDDAERQAFHTTIAIAAVAAGKLPHEHDRLLLDEGAAFVGVPIRVGGADVAHVEQAARLARSLDLQYGGELAGQVAYQVLRWAVGLLEATMTEQVRRRLHLAVGVLALWAGWSGVDAGRHGAARALFMMALQAAVRADEPDLRAHVIADVGAQHNHLAYPAGALQVVRLADGDERVGPAVKCMLHGVRARAYAALAEHDQCRHEIALAEDAAARVEPQTVPQWLGGWEPAHVQAVCGHASARLAEASGNLADLAEAHKRLAAAADDLAAANRLRASALCLIQLARAHQRCGSVDEVDAWMDQAQRVAQDLRSARVSRDLAALRVASNGGATSIPASPPGNSDQR